MSTSKYFTEEGLKKVKDELHHLITVERPNISRQIAEARDKGDLSENSEYDAAKEAQGLLEIKIASMQDVIRNAKIIDESKLDDSKVLILSKVKVLNMANNKAMEYTIVPENEANLKEYKLSVASPIAKGLLGKTKGETVKIQVPAGIITLKILEIGR
ncbi:MAG: transcription elongation factor GreA [Bacteroidales bacterium]|nr:transcription elongation factor GreA [Bacteroidales bacterium]